MTTGSWEPSGGPDPRRPRRPPPQPRAQVRGRPPGPARPRPSGEPRDETHEQSRRPARPQRRATLPMMPTLGVAALVVLLAFVAGRVTAGGSDTEVGASPVTSPSTTTTTRTRTHTVATGESLLAIASRYGVTLDELAAANGITNANRVFVGQVLQIPPPSVSTTLLTTTTSATGTTRATATTKP